MLTFDLEGAGESERIDVEIDQVVIAGWTGRDQAKIDEHIEELKEIGVSPPSSTPLYYRVGAESLTQYTSPQVVGEDSSGEAEAVLIGTASGVIVTIGSDHTDRKAEAYSVALSKQCCPKPLGTKAWRYADVADIWDSLKLKSWLQEGSAVNVYQDGGMDMIRAPGDLIAGYLGGAPELPAGTAMFLGTVPAIGGLRGGGRFECALIDEAGGRELRFAYTTDNLPVVA